MNITTTTGKSGRSEPEIAKALGVNRQRVYQMINKENK